MRVRLAGWMDGWMVCHVTHTRTHPHRPSAAPSHHGTALPHHSWVLSRPHSLLRAHRGGAGRVGSSLGRSDFCSHVLCSHRLTRSTWPSPSRLVIHHPITSFSSHLILGFLALPRLALLWFGWLVGLCVDWVRARSLSVWFMWMDGWMDVIAGP